MAVFGKSNWKVFTIAQQESMKIPNYGTESFSYAQSFATIFILIFKKKSLVCTQEKKKKTKLNRINFPVLSKEHVFTNTITHTRQGNKTTKTEGINNDKHMEKT